MSCRTSGWFLPALLFGWISCTHPRELPKVYTIEIAQMKFMPAEVKVHPGDTVRFINHDLVVHDITEEKNKEWSSGQLPAGQSWSMAVSKTADYFCSIHPVMKGRITVE